MLLRGDESIKAKDDHFDHFDTTIFICYDFNVAGPPQTHVLVTLSPVWMRGNKTTTAGLLSSYYMNPLVTKDPVPDLSHVGKSKIMTYWGCLSQYILRSGQPPTLELVQF